MSSLSTACISGVTVVWLAGCSGTGKLAPPSLIGEWRQVTDAGTQFMFFNADGTFGEGGEATTGQSFCVPGSWRYEGGDVYITENQTNVRNEPVDLAYDTLTIKGGGQYPDIVYTRENSLPANHCP